MDDVRDRILDAALPLVAERGVYGAALADVAAASGVPAPALGVLYTDVHGIANELYRRWKGELASAILGDGPIAADPREQFRLFWYRAADFATLHPHPTAFLRASAHAPWLDEASLALEDQVHALLVGFFTTLRGDKVLRDETPEILVALVLGAFDGMFEASRRGRLPMTDATIAAAERAVWAAIRR